MLRHVALVLTLLVATATGLACGTSPKSSVYVSPAGSNDASLPVSDAGSGGGDGPSLITGDEGGTPSPGPVTLAITPLAPVVTVVTGQPLPTKQFTATVNGQPESLAWSIDRGELGTIDSTGLFTAAGTLGGVGNIKAAYGSQTATTPITVNVQTLQQGDPAWSSTPPDAGAGGYGGVGGDGPGAPPTATQIATLNGSPTADSTVSVLYPYDGTVWPQGLLAPLLQWQSGTHAFDSVFVDLKENNYEYKGYFAANTTPFVNVPIPQQAWSTLGFSNSGEPVEVSLVFAEGGTAYGPYTETWTIAQAPLQGTIYYNSYGTALVKNSDSVDSYGLQYGAGTLSIAPGGTAPTLVAGVNSPGAQGDGTGCRVCHTVAANGQSLVTQTSDATASDYSVTVSLDLASDSTGGAGTPVATSNLAFPALYKDGSLLLSNSSGFRYQNSGTALTQLYAMPAGTPVAGVTGLGTGLRAGLPSFSPDGTHVSFNFWAGTLTAGATTLTGDQMSLAELDFDGKSTFSNPRILFTPPAGTSVTYSSFFPDNSAIVFEVELTNPSDTWGYTWDENTAEIWWLDTATGQAHRLDALNGYAAGGAIYLQGNAGGANTHTPAEDVTLNYEPTVTPIASGGYAWVVFTSRRMYGNVAQLSPWTSDPRYYPWLDEVTDKKLWVAAVDLNAKAGSDPSHPPFYLPGQELHAGNARGYWSVNPCHANGQSCVAGDECCGGYCQPSADAGLVCSSQMPTCAAEYEKCTTTSDCCGSAQGITCINGVCTLSQPAK